MIAALLAALLTPPPPPPMARLGGGQPLCHARFAVQLAAAEAAEQHGADHWVVARGTASFGIRTWSAAELASLREHTRGSQRPRAVEVPGLPGALRFRVRQWDGGGQPGWGYLLPDGANYVFVASFEFTGHAPDHATLQRVLTGDARARLCPVRPPQEPAR